MPILQSGAGQLILSATSTGTGSWYRVNQKMGDLTFQSVQVGTSVAATITSTVKIEVSNDGVNALTSLTTPMVIAGDSPATGGLTAGCVLAAGQHWEYVRANLSGYGATSAASTGARSNVSVYVSGTMRS